MEIDGEKFKRDFDKMVLGGDLLLQSDRERYASLKRKIRERSHDRYLSGKTAELGVFPRDFPCELLFKDGHSYKIRVPYGWADLGYFVFDSIASRMERIVVERLMPPLARYGMSAEEIERYERLLGRQRTKIEVKKSPRKRRRLP